jgi:hypothetical protein
MMKKPPPLLGYNTNVRHNGNLYHIQTDDSGVDHPHIITHLFVEGTILATKKSSYADVLSREDWEKTVREMMKDQHRCMFVELRDGLHDDVTAKLSGGDGGLSAPAESVEDFEIDIDVDAPTIELDDQRGVRVIRPANMDERRSDPAVGSLGGLSEASRGRSIFDTPNDNGEFGENLITDKSLDEVILSYLTDELDES